MRTRALEQVYDTLLFAYLKSVLFVGEKSNANVHVYDGITVSLADIIASTCTVFPISFPALFLLVIGEW